MIASKIPQHADEEEVSIFIMYNEAMSCFLKCTLKFGFCAVENPRIATVIRTSRSRCLIEMERPETSELQWCRY